MRANTELVEAVIGYDYSALRRELARRGAVSSGVSGMGPSIAAIGPTSTLRELVDAMPESPGVRRSVSFSKATPVAGGRAA
jgi:shikimate kinase